jgi:tetratricopeptide (TPR) repeat protein
MNEATVEVGTNESNGQAGLHMGIAMRGKLYALEGNHAKALQYYRIAIRMAVNAKEPEIFFRHYLDCVMESLELTGAYDEVLAYCDKAIEHYGANPPPNPLAKMDLATIHLRRTSILLKKQDKKEARASVKRAVDTARSAGGKIGLAETILRWLDAGFSIDTARLLAEQKRGGYFCVQREKVDPNHAIELSETELMAIGRF